MGSSHIVFDFKSLSWMLQIEKFTRQNEHLGFRFASLTESRKTGRMHMIVILADGPGLLLVSKIHIIFPKRIVHTSNMYSEIMTEEDLEFTCKSFFLHSLESYFINIEKLPDPLPPL